MRRAVELARRFAPTELPVLLIGETGTGKEVLAQAIHRWSGRAGRIVEIDCSVLSPGMVSKELFGHRRGSFTGAVESVAGLVEQADGGTLFLDELCSLAPEEQAVLLRVVETGEIRRVGDAATRRVSLKVVAAAQALNTAGGKLALRGDLFQRLAGGIIHLPPLSLRPEDLWPLARHFAAQAGRELAPSVIPVLQRYEWPGNVRELRQVIGRAATVRAEGLLDGGVLAEAIDLGVTAAEERAPPVPSDSMERERAQLIAACRHQGGNAVRIAAELGVSRPTVYRRLVQFGVRLEEYRCSIGNGRAVRTS